MEVAKPLKAQPKVVEEENIFALVGKKMENDLPPIPKRSPSEVK